MLHRCLPLLQLQRNPAPPCDKTLITDATSFFHTLWKITRVMTQRSGLNLICSRQQDKKKQKKPWAHPSSILVTSLSFCLCFCNIRCSVPLLSLFWSGKSFLDPFKIEFKIILFYFLKKIYRINTFCVLCHQKYEV